MKKSYLGILAEIDRTLEKSWNEDFSRKNFSILFKFPYPKLVLLALMTAAAYYIFSQSGVGAYFSGIGDLSYIGAFVSGLLFSFGFTTPFAIGIFMSLPANNIFLAAAIGGFGAMISDFLIFTFIKASFIDEFEKIKKTKSIRIFLGILEKNIPEKIKHYILFIMAGLVIASPLPDEIGIIMVAGISSIKPRILAALSFIFNTLGILILLLI